MRLSPMNVAITGFSNPHANHQLTTTHRMVNGARILYAPTSQVSGLPENKNQGAVRSIGPYNSLHEHEQMWSNYIDNPRIITAALSMILQCRLITFPVMLSQQLNVNV